MIISGTAGILYTYSQISAEKVVTPEDASISSTAVRGPLTLKAQADAIRMHTLNMAGGKTYAELPRTVPQIDENGNAVLNEQGEPIMVSNKVRETWVTATTLQTALQLGLMAYALSVLVVVLGILFLFNGFVLTTIKKHLCGDLCTERNCCRKKS